MGLDFTTQREVRIVGIIRGCPPSYLAKVAEAAALAGIRALEVTLDSPDPGAGILRLRTELPEVAVGAGTVLSRTDVAVAGEAGAEFIVSPVTDHRILDAAHAWGLTCIPGASTPTEIRQAFRAGADAVKVFPAEQLGGPSFLSAVLTPLGEVPLVPTGGIGSQNAQEYLNAGAAAVGVGSELFPPNALEEGDAHKVATLAEELVRACDGA